MVVNVETDESNSDVTDCNTTGAAGVGAGAGVTQTVMLAWREAYRPDHMTDDVTDDVTDESKSTGTESAESTAVKHAHHLYLYEEAAGGEGEAEGGEEAKEAKEGESRVADAEQGARIRTHSASGSSSRGRLLLHKPMDVGNNAFVFRPFEALTLETPTQQRKSKSKSKSKTTQTEKTKNLNRSFAWHVDVVSTVDGHVVEIVEGPLWRFTVLGL